MSELMEKAHETIEEHAHHSDGWARGVAVLVSVLAAALAITGIGAQSSQNAYLTHHIERANDFAFYQARNLRAEMRETEAAILAGLPNAQDADVQTRIKDAQAIVARLHDDPERGQGMKQLLDRARHEEAERDEAEHRYHSFEYASGALEIAIVLASVSVVTRVRALAVAAGVIGACACLGAIAVTTQLF